MKRYAVFAWDITFPEGGMGDFVKAFDTKEYAEGFLDNFWLSDDARDMAYVVDMQDYLGDGS